MTIKHATKAQAVALKSAPSEEGQFEALVAVFNNIDSYGDVILKGAFADTLTEWGDSGYPIPVVWSHDKDDPFSHIGTVTEAKETDTGLVVKAQLDLENPKAAQVHRLLKGGRVKEFSFAFSYDLEDVNPAKRDGVEVRELKRLKLYEVGPTLVGANPATELVGVKSLESEKADGDEDQADDDGEKSGDTPEVPDWDAAKKLMTDASEILTQLSDIITRNTAEDSDEKSDDDDGDEASRSQTDDDETEGKSSEVPADRSAEEQKSYAALYAAILQGETDEDVEGTAG